MLLDTLKYKHIKHSPPITEPSRPCASHHRNIRSPMLPQAGFEAAWRQAALDLTSTNQMQRANSRQLKEVICRTAAASDPYPDRCWHHVNWAKLIGVQQHSEWFPGLTNASSNAVFQAFLNCQPAAARPLGFDCPPPCYEPSSSPGVCKWTGVPSTSQPLPCGALWFFHIEKTAGTSVVSHLKMYEEF